MLINPSRAIYISNGDHDSPHEPPQIESEGCDISHNDQQSEQYGPPCSLCGGFNHSPKHCYKGEHNINNIMEKMSINPHQSQQSNLYQ